MAGRSKAAMAQLNVIVPRGQDGYWAIMLQLDQDGPWSLRDVELRSNVPGGTIARFLRKLVRGGVVAAAGTRPSSQPSKVPATTYRLLKHPPETPRLAEDGTELPERQIDTIWRSMKMAKSFSAGELADFASVEGRPVDRLTVRRYLRELSHVGVVVRVSTRTRKDEARYRIGRNIGAKAPMILSTTTVFDPNSGEILGATATREVQP